MGTMPLRVAGCCVVVNLLLPGCLSLDSTVPPPPVAVSATIESELCRRSCEEAHTAWVLARSDPEVQGSLARGYGRVLELLERARRLDPGQPLPASLYASAALSMALWEPDPAASGRWMSAASEALDGCLKVSPDWAPGWLVQSELSLLAGQRTEAARALEQADRAIERLQALEVWSQGYATRDGYFEPSADDAGSRTVPTARHWSLLSRWLALERAWSLDQGARQTSEGASHRTGNCERLRARRELAAARIAAAECQDARVCGERVLQAYRRAEQLDGLLPEVHIELALWLKESGSPELALDHLEPFLSESYPLTCRNARLVQLALDASVALHRLTPSRSAHLRITRYLARLALLQPHDPRWPLELARQLEDGAARYPDAEMAELAQLAQSWHRLDSERRAALAGELNP